MTKKKTIYDRLFDIFFIAYVTCVFCFNDSTSGIKYVYISMILVTGIAFLSLISGGTRLNVKAELVLLLLYLAYGCLVSMKAVYSVPVALERARTVALCIVPSIIICHYLIIRGNNDVLPLAFAVGGFIMSIYVIVHYGGLSAFYHQASKEGTRLGGEIIQTNSLGMAAAYAVVVFYYYMLKKKQIYLGAFAVLPFIVAMASGSRKALIIVALGVVMLSVLMGSGGHFTPSKVIKMLLILVLIALVAFFISNLPFMATVLERMQGMFDVIKTGKGDHSAWVRSKMTEVGLKEFPNHPVFGIGFNNAKYLNVRYTGYFTYLHNDFIEQLVNLGTCGFILFYGNFFLILKKHIAALRKGNLSIVLSLTLLCIFLINIVGNVVYYSKTTYLFLIYWISSIYIYKEDKTV